MRRATSLLRRLTGLGCLGLAGALAVWTHAGPGAAAVSPVATPGPTPTRYLFDVALPDTMDDAALAQEISTRYLAATFELRGPASVDGSESSYIRVSRRALGAVVDLGALTAALAEARTPGSTLREAHLRRGVRDRVDVPFFVELSPEPLRGRLLAWKDEVDAPPVDAKLAPDGMHLVSARDGRALDVYATMEEVADALESGGTRADVVMRTVPAGLRHESLVDADFATELGEFETRYDASGNAKDRTHNLRVAAAKLDGLILPPGAEFSFDARVGERNEASGFRPAKVIEGGDLVDGLGGGACQIAGTLHAAAFFGAFPIVERHPHSRPSWYIRLGLDAAVSYGQLDFRFRNDRPYPVAIRFVVAGGRVRASLLGARRDATVTFSRRIDAVLPYDERVIQDATLPTGVRWLAQRGMAGFEVTRYRVVRDVASTVAKRESLVKDRYPPTTQLVHVGTGGPRPANFVAPRDDDHGEYLADAYFTLTAGPDIDGYLERKRPGEPGSPGFTTRAGMPVSSR